MSQSETCSWGTDHCRTAPFNQVTAIDNKVAASDQQYFDVSFRMTTTTALKIKISVDLAYKGFDTVEAQAIVNFCEYAQVDDKYFQNAD